MVGCRAIRLFPRFSGVLLASTLACAALTGCSDPNLAKRAEVSGTVTLDGQPVENGSITFMPTGGTSGPSAGGAIVNGEYHLSQAEGPVIGENRIEFNGARKTGRKVKDRFGDEMTQDEVVPLFPNRYNMESKEVRKVDPGENKIDFNLTTK